MHADVGGRPDTDRALRGDGDRSSVNIADRSAAYRKGGWRQFDPKSKPLTADEIRRVRLAHTDGRASVF
jgi:hypothetical protein